MVQWLQLCPPNAGVPDSTTGQKTRSNMPQLKSPCAATQIQQSQINIFLKVLANRIQQHMIIHHDYMVTHHDQVELRPVMQGCSNM